MNDNQLTAISFELKKKRLPPLPDMYQARRYRNWSAFKHWTHYRKSTRARQV